MKERVQQIRHSTLRQKAEIIDFIVDRYKKVRGRKTFPKGILKDIVPLFFLNSRYIGRGFHKEVFAIRSRAHIRVLKISNAKSTKRDLRVYNRLHPNIRNRYFAKIYWQTKYCLLQKFGIKASVPAKEIRRLKGIGN
ncbi:MAG TPA: hypothetical protein VG475_17305, partial [Pseudolabrys sp.]|nr:hypothetical protein [Pseudolabrys sp.]